MREFKLTDTQIQLFKIGQEAATKAATDAQKAIDFANEKQQSVKNLITMFCDSTGLSIERTSINLDRGVAIEADPPVDDVK